MNAYDNSLQIRVMFIRLLSLFFIFKHYAIFAVELQNFTTFLHLSPKNLYQFLHGVIQFQTISDLGGLIFLLIAIL